MDRVNVLYLHETSKISGAENSLINLVKNLDRKRFSPCFILPEDGPLVSEIKSLKIPVILIPFPKIRYGLGVLKTIGQLRGFIKEKNISLVHSNSIRTHIYGSIAAKYTGIFSIWHQRNLITNEIIDLDRLFSFLPDRIICNSAAIARRFQSRGHIPEKVRIVLNGVDTVSFNPSIDGAKIREEFAIQPNEIVVGIASRFNLQKGHETFLNAAAIILSCQTNLQNKIRFLIAGGAVFRSDKKREQYLQDVAKKLGISDRVIFTGFRKDMPQVYAAMDIFVLASDAEPCGRVIFEAMASGKPLIATDSGGTPEIVQDGVSGYLFTFGDSQGLAEKILYFCNNPDLAKKMGQAGRKRVEDNFSIEKNVRQIEDIYIELCQ